MLIKRGIILTSFLVLTACQTTPEIQQPKHQSSEKPRPKGIPTPDGVKIIPYDQGEITKKSLPSPPSSPKVIVPKQQAAKIQPLNDGTSIPAYKNIIQNAHAALKGGKWDEAEKYALHAQRIAPQAAEPFLYLALISDYKNQNQNAESLARRGLSYAQTTPMKRELWKVILKSGAKQKNTKTIAEAQNHLKNL